ncbi:MAG TPA: hypothetical protein VM733_02450, partial [Thermoanaerobaculia bacterium]|nr:hypothetical protein [Thermoanaerobaculia bacterium]
KDGLVVNGFGIGIRGASTQESMREALRNAHGAFARVAALYRSSSAQKAAGLTAEMLRGEWSEARFVAQLRAFGQFIDGALADLDKRGADSFGTRTYVEELRKAAAAKDANAALLAMNSLANTVDARVTSIELAKGNPADILQTLRWGRDLFATRLAKADCAAQLVRDTDDFERALGMRKAQMTDYPRLLQGQRECLAGGGKLLGLDVSKELDAISSAGTTDYAALQKAHSDLLLRLAENMR